MVGGRGKEQLMPARSRTDVVPRNLSMKIDAPGATPASPAVPGITEVDWETPLTVRVSVFRE